MENEETKGNGPTTHRPPAVPTKKRNGSAMSLLRAAAFMIGRRSKKSAVAEANAIKSLVDGMRPLHHQIEYCAPPPPPPSLGITRTDSFHDVLQPPPSPCCPEGMSRYASAEDLQALDTSEGEEEGGSSGEPNAIDVQAEEFIAMFYKQMKLQRSDSFKLESNKAVEQSACMVEQSAD